jgi:4'-phosphopantetheinyl transferase
MIVLLKIVFICFFMSVAVPVLVEHHTIQGLPSSLELPTLGTIHLWSARTDPDPALAIAAHQEPIFFTLLSSDEQARAQCYIVAKARRQFVEVRGLLRVLLGAYLHRKPTSIEFIYSDNGKPSLSATSDEVSIQFNVSHSQAQVLYAFSTDHAIGVDIEGVNPLISYVDLAHRICTPQERRVFDQLPTSLQPQAFYKIWTRKEALVKLGGDRLYEKLSIFEVPAHSTAGTYWVQAEDRQVWLQDLELVDSFAGAIALPHAPQRIIHHQWLHHR